jgi:hypothetical protein
MKRGLLILVIWALGGSQCWSEDFLGVPLLPGGEVTISTTDKVQVRYALSHEQVLEFYKSHFKASRDIKFRDWKAETYIEDQGALPWHSVRISKGQETVTVTITRDSWTWILGTLTLRFIGVFVVLLFLYVGISVSGAIMSRLLAKAD